MRDRAAHATALLLSLASALLLLSAGRPGMMLGNWQHPDALANHWVMRWVAERTLSGGSLRWNDLYYWPIGDDPLTNGNAMEGFSYLPFAALLSWPDALSAWALVVLTANGLGAWALARASGLGPGPGWLACAAVATHPYPAAELSAGHFPQANLAWMLFALAALIRLLREGRGLLPTILLVTLCGIFYWYHAIFLSIAALFVVADEAVQTRGRLRWWVLPTILLASLALVGPWLAYSLRAQVPGLGEAFPHPEARTAALHAGWPVGATGAYQQGRVAALALVLLAIPGLRRGWAWLGLGLVAWSLGAAGWSYEALYGLAEPLRRFWWPYRHGALLLMAWAMLAACGLERLRARPALGLLLALSLPVQLHLSGDLLRVKFSPMQGLEILEDLPEGVVMEPPLFPGSAVSQGVLLSQMRHGLPTLTGHALWVDRVRPDAWDRFVVQSPFLGGLQRWERGGPSRVPTTDLGALRAAGLRWLVVSPGRFARELALQLEGYRALGRALGGAPARAERGVEIYEITQTPASIELPAVRWPAGLRPGGPARPLDATPLPDPVFGEVVGGATR